MYIYFVYINPSSVSAKLPACSSEKLLVWVEDIIILCLFPSVQCVHALRGFTRQGDDRMLEGKLETPPPPEKRKRPRNQTMFHFSEYLVGCIRLVNLLNTLDYIMSSVRLMPENFF